jgi:hypothetical protein
MENSNDGALPIDGTQIKIALGHFGLHAEKRVVEIRRARLASARALWKERRTRPHKSIS